MLLYICNNIVAATTLKTLIILLGLIGCSHETSKGFFNFMIENLENEEWKPIVGYESAYEISNLGRVKALSRTQKMPGNGGFKVSPEIILKQHKTNHGHLYIDLTKENKRKKYLIHRLVAIHFISNPNNYPNVLHGDNDSTNNNKNNLSWGTQAMNMHDKIRHSTHKKGEDIPNCILTELQVKEIKTLYNKKKGFTYKKIGELYNVNKGTIGDIIKERTWKHI